MRGSLRRARQGLPAPAARPPAEWREANTFLFGGEEVPIRLLEFDTLVSGGKGTGKTTALQATMLSIFRAWQATGKPFNAHVYTPKPDDFYPILKATFDPLGIPVRPLNPFLKASWVWDGAMDLDTPPKIDELVSAVIKEEPNDRDQFFKKAAQLVVRGGIQSLASTHRGVWTMRHLANVLKSPRSIEELLARCEHTRHVLSLLSSEQGRTAANLHATILAELKGLDLVAALLDGTRDDRRFSIVEAANTPGVIWVWGSDPRYSTTVEPWNGIQWELLGHELLIRGDIGIDTFLMVDEFPQLNGGMKLPIMKKLLEFSRSSRVRSLFAVQTPSQVMDIHGQRGGDTLMGQFHCAMVFRHSDIEGREYWSKRFGRMHGFEEKRGYSRQVGGSTTSGAQPSWSSSWSETTSVNFERYERERVTASDIGDLPVGTYELGMYGYAMLPLSLHPSARTGYPEPIMWQFHLTPGWIARHVPEKGSIRPYQKNLKSPESYTLRPLEGWEWDFLGLTRPD